MEKPQLIWRKKVKRVFVGLAYFAGCMMPAFGVYHYKVVREYQDALQSRRAVANVTPALWISFYAEKDPKVATGFFNIACVISGQQSQVARQLVKSESRQFDYYIDACPKTNLPTETATQASVAALKAKVAASYAAYQKEEIRAWKAREHAAPVIARQVAEE